MVNTGHHNPSLSQRLTVTPAPYSLSVVCYTLICFKVNERTFSNVFKKLLWITTKVLIGRRYGTTLNKTFFQPVFIGTVFDLICKVAGTEGVPGYDAFPWGVAKVKSYCSVQFKLFLGEPLPLAIEGKSSLYIFPYYTEQLVMTHHKPYQYKTNIRPV